MPFDEAALARGCGGTLKRADQLCRRELDRFRTAAASGAPVTVGCTQERAVFADGASEIGADGRIAYTNIRENAGWSKDAATAGPKMAALLAAAADETPPVPMVSFESNGVALTAASPTPTSARTPAGR